MHLSLWKLISNCAAYIFLEKRARSKGSEFSDDCKRKPSCLRQLLESRFREALEEASDDAWPKKSQEIDSDLPSQNGAVGRSRSLARLHARKEFLCATSLAAECIYSSEDSIPRGSAFKLLAESYPFQADKKLTFSSNDISLALVEGELRSRHSSHLLKGLLNIDKEAVTKLEGILSLPAGNASCTLEVIKALPILNKVYGDSMHKVLHVVPDTCSVVPEFLKEEDTRAWGVEPYDLEDASAKCKRLVRKGMVLVADIKFPLPHKANSFSLVLVSDALDNLSARYLNKTLPELARLATDGVVIFTSKLYISIPFIS